jgi:hypothetical protein
MHLLVAVMCGILLWQTEQHSYWKDLRKSTSDLTQPIRPPLAANSTLATAPSDELVTPSIQDVLISSRLSRPDASNRIYAQANLLDYHVGNRLWKQRVMATAVANGAKQDELVEELMGPSSTSRYLQQVQNGWVELKDEQRASWIRDQLETSH